MENDQLRELLADLAAVNFDRAKAYEEASQQNQLYDVELRATFALLANQSRQNSMIMKLQLEKLTTKRGTPPPGRGALYNQWKEQEAAFTGADKNSMLESCRIGETAVQSVYASAMGNKLKPDLRQILESQVKGLQSSATIISEILDLYREKKDYRRY